MNNPTPTQIKQSRLEAGLTQKQAAKLVYSTTRTWQNWESTGPENRKMHPAIYELFIIKVSNEG